MFSKVKWLSGSVVFCTACGRVRGNRTRPARNGRFARPCDRSTITRLPSGRSPARLASFSRVPFGCGPDRDRACHPGRIRRFTWAFGHVPVPRLAAPAVLTRHLRRDASSAEYRLSRLACIWRPKPRTASIRRHSTRHSSPRAAPHLVKGAFVFAVSAAALRTALAKAWRSR